MSKSTFADVAAHIEYSETSEAPYKNYSCCNLQKSYMELPHYENMPISSIQKISPPKTEHFQTKNMIYFMFMLKT